MKKTLYAIGLSMFIFLTTAHSIYAYSATVQSTYWGPIQHIFTAQGVDGFYVTSCTENDCFAANACPNGYWFFVPSTHPKYNEFLSIAITSMTAGKNVNMGSEDYSCPNGYPMLTLIYFDK